ncbi:hypothetical protein MMC10_000190 [Thelotrema lepadinum]|nr:hypothetical protein [Thelotrema lepadinum]
MIVFPVLREWLSTIVASGGMGVVILMVGMGVAGWAWGKTQMEGGGPEGGGSAGASSKGQHMPGSPPPNGAPPSSSEPPPRPKPTWTRSTPAPGAGAANASAKTAWEKAREETRKKEEDRKKTEEARKKREDEEKERVRQREREAREREIRELREAREKREREAKAAREANQRGSQTPSPTKGRHQQPSAHTEADEETYSFRPYDKPKVSPSKSSGTGSIYSSSYAASQSTARSTPPPSHRGPYHTKDPDKIVLKAVYSFNNTFMKLPIAQLVSGVKPVTDGLILRITTEGLFIDDDVRGVPQREWDVKAWTMKLVETTEYKGIHVVRASIRDQEGKRYVFILQEEEGWKVAVGLQRLRRGSQVRALGVSGMPVNEARAVLENMGWA